jgi:glycosyltransferase involved in cell wall biosynthesis
VSDGVRRSAIDYFGLPPERVLTMVNFIDLQRIDHLAQEPLADWEAGRFHIVACGRLHAQKGFDLLLKAMADLVHRRKRTRALLHILGSGPLADELQQQVEDAALAGHVRFHGFVANPFAFFHRAQLFCLSSVYEGFGLVLAEAMACRVPVLSTDCPSGPSEILQDGRYGRLVPVADVAALADGIQHAMDNHAAWGSVTESARQHVEREYSPAARVRELEALLAGVCGRDA